MAASQIDTLKMIRAQLRTATAEVPRLDRRISQNARKLINLQLRLEQPARISAANRRRWELQITELQRVIAEDQGAMQEAINERDRLLERQQELATQVNEREQNQYAIPASATDSVTVRMLSGDMLCAMVDSRQKVRDFPLEFARQFGYNPKAISRFQFLIQNPDEEDGELVNILANDQDYELSWLDRFENPDKFPLLHLLIQASSDADLPEKVRLIRQIVEEQKLTCSMSDEDLMEHFNNWYLTYQPPAKSNRYITMKDFVTSSSHLFTQISEEDVAAMLAQRQTLDARYDVLAQQVQELNARSSALNNVLRVREFDAREHRLIERYTLEEDDYQHQRATAAIMFAQQIRDHPTADFMNHRQTRAHFIHCLTRFEMAEMGYVAGLISRCNCPHSNCPDKTVDPVAVWQDHLQHIAEHGQNSTQIIRETLISIYQQVETLSQEVRSTSFELRDLTAKLYRMKILQ
jgi:hypothetical protein